MAQRSPGLGHLKEEAVAAVDRDFGPKERSDRPWKNRCRVCLKPTGLSVVHNLAHQGAGLIALFEMYRSRLIFLKVRKIADILLSFIIVSTLNTGKFNNSGDIFVVIEDGRFSNEEKGRPFVQDSPF